MKLIGHKTEETYKRYRIVDESDLNDAVEKLDDYFRGQKAVADQKVLFFREAKKTGSTRIRVGKS